MKNYAMAFENKYGWTVKYLSLVGIVAMIYLGSIFVQKDEYKEDQAPLKGIPYRMELMEEFRAEQRVVNAKHSDQQVEVLKAIAEVNRQLSIQNTLNEGNVKRLERIEDKQDKVVANTTP